jgi:hypothetical protein
MEKNNCPLIFIMNKQIKGDDYNNPLLWHYERLDNIANILNIDINESIQRNILATYLEKIYKPFDDYLINEHQEAFIRHRNSRYASDMEYHALHEYLKIKGFTKDNVCQFIEIDRYNRYFFRKYREEGQNKYFNKYGQGQLKINDYNSNIFKKYSYICIYEDKDFGISQLSI